MKTQKPEARSQKSGARKIAPGLSPICYLPAPARRERGIALVITLIMLSVTLIMAVAFLALSRRERSAVATTTDTAVARLAADSALAAAQAQIAASIFATNTAAYDYHLLVSTNYLPLTFGDLGDLTNLFILPRAPVYIITNNNGPADYRFYLDANRNGQFESNGWIADVDSTGFTNGNFSFQVGDPEWIGVLERPDQPHSANNHFVARYAFMAQPIGNGLDLNYIHNQVMDGNSAITTVNNNLSDAFFRNQGVGSWEINLAAFLADLNTNQWGQVIGDALNVNTSYYYQYPGGGNHGVAFYDAQSILAWRYANDYSSLAKASQIFPNAANVFPYDNIDAYSDGPLQFTSANINENLSPSADADLHPGTISWAGADNTNRFFSLPSDLFDTSKIVPTNFVYHLATAGTSNSTYDRYTFYRLLDQLGTDSSADGGKMNLNFRNMTNGAVVSGMETNLLAWSPLEFFTNAADRMLRSYSSNWFAAGPSNYLLTYYGMNYADGYVDRHTGYGFTNALLGTNMVPAFGIANIPVQVNGNFVYSPAVNRVLQLAANLYDASTNSFYPSVFRPKFTRDTLGNLYVAGYTNIDTVTGIGDVQLGTAFDSSQVLLPTANNVFVNVYGVPWIIGAKKNIPSFNQLYMNNLLQVTRKAEVSRNNTNLDATTIYKTNQMYVMSMTNNLGISFWNSYSNTYPHPVTVYGSDTIQISLTNEIFPNGFQFQPSSPFVSTTNFIYTTNITTWSGSKWGVGTGNTIPGFAAPNPNAYSFYSVNWTFNSLPESIYRLSTGYLVPSSGGQTWETNQPLWGLDHQGVLGLSITNSLQAFILDGNKVIDYVQLRGPIDHTNVNQVLADPDYPQNSAQGYMWSTNAYQPPSLLPPFGIVDQILVSRGSPGYSAPNPKDWIRPPQMPASISSTPADEKIFFDGFFKPSFQYNQQVYLNGEYVVQAPYTPTRSVYYHAVWQANDPLVHYMGSDLAYVDPGTIGWNNSDKLTLPPTSLGSVGDRYQPWGWSKQMQSKANVDSAAYNTAFKDSLVWCPENWDFPTNLYPTIGWIGRVHRGTPWQTVYLKATNVLQDAAGYLTWPTWTGNQNYFDATNASPLQDQILFDLFTTRFNDNAAHGTLSVNQKNLAAWSALFGGMVVLSNNAVNPQASYTIRPSTTWYNLNPAGVDTANSQLWQILNGANGINAARTNANMFSSGVFTHVGDILNVSALSDRSPFLNLNYAQKGISDEVYEWLPQQALGLLRVSSSPRYVVYCYGQSLRPAKDSVVTSSGAGLFGIVTNYQIMAESAARAVIRLDAKVVNNVTNYSATVESYNVLPPN